MHNGATVLEPECTVRAHLTRGVRQVLIQWIGEPPSSATWEDLEGFADRYPSFQLEDELLIEGGRDVMWGRHYQRLAHVRSDCGSAEQALATISG